MASTVIQYLQSVQKALATGHAQEHSYRPALKTLFESVTRLHVINEPKGSAHGRPDLIFLNKDIPIAWVEAKDLHANLDKVEKSEQMTRYFGYANLILTNGLEFRFFKNGKRYGDAVVIAMKKGDTLEPTVDRFELLERLIADFIREPADTIRSAEHLAKIMGGKAARLRDNIKDMLNPDFAGTKGIEIEKIRDVLKVKLIHDLSNEQFADLYAQTLVYGLFVARYHDHSPKTFSRAEARETIPANNHLLQQFFDHIAGANFEKKLSHIVDELCEVFRHADVHALVHGLYLNNQGTHDPIIHFYEDFLREYDPKLRTERGVFYTPLPVVRYIVRSVDALLKEHFGLKDGLADRSTIEYSAIQQGTKVKRSCDRVQILDPAVGTGTFLNEVIRHIHGTFRGQEGSWPMFVKEHLLNRLNGFELMMASYTIAHLKLSMTLAETGVKETRKRLRVFLTNSLEQAEETQSDIFSFGLSQAITEEAGLAAEVKRDLPVMVVLGNPPYSVSSQNASVTIGPDKKKKKTWIGELLDEYKKDLNEKKINLDDDYIKFIRFAHHLIEKNGQGIMAMITNNSFLDGVTHRRMRESLLKTFDHIYVVDLHGSTKRKEKAPDGGKDENVFDIQQGVCISLCVRCSGEKRKRQGRVHHIDLYGTRAKKYAWLEGSDSGNTEWHELESRAPSFFFVPKDFANEDEYRKNTLLNELFSIGSNGIETQRDSTAISFHEAEILSVVSSFLGSNSNEIKLKFNIEKEGRDWTIGGAIDDLKKGHSIIEIIYRPFDKRMTAYSGRSKGFIAYPRHDVSRHIVCRENLVIEITQKNRCISQGYVFVSRVISDRHLLDSAGDSMSFFPLYLYPDRSNESAEKRVPNLNMKLLSPVLKKLKLEWVVDGMGDGENTCGPEDVFDYMYGVLHSPSYRSRYKEFLKIDFPRVPFTEKSELFWRLVKLGREIRELHLLESPSLGTLRTTFPIAGDNVVEKIHFEDEVTGKVWINSLQYFGDVPKIAWEFFIGGYRPAEKWLKDRKGRTLSSDEILHYQRVIVALVETDRLMKEVDAAVEECGGWPMK